MLTSEIVFDYVWLHFCSIFPEAAALPVNYGNQRTANLSISSGGLAFLNQKLPFPETLFCIEWQGRSLPVLQQEENPELVSEKENQVKINADIIASAFYFLSGWQEYFSNIRDKFNRFPYRASLQAKHSFVTVPVVNYYFQILKAGLEKAYGISLKNYPEASGTFTTFLSHDVDRLESAWKVEGLKQLKKGNYLQTAKLISGKTFGKDHWHNLETVTETVKKYGAVSTFFWLAKSGKFNGHPNADYDIAKPAYQNLIRKLAAAGFENGIHGSFGSSENATQLKAETARLNQPVKGNRFHYLCFNPELTPEVLSAAGLNYDSTLGFAEHFGFRNGYCFPFRPFSFKTLKPATYLQIPLNLMDATLWHPNYLQLPPEKIVEAIGPMLQEIKNFGGVFGLLWHNENFSSLNTRNGLAVFESIMQELNILGTQYQTGSAIYKNHAGRLLRKG